MLEGANVLVDAAIRVRGLNGQRTMVSVEADGRIVGSEEVVFPASGDIYNARVSVRATSGEGRATTYASVIDLKTNDPTYIPAQ